VESDGAKALSPSEQRHSEGTDVQYKSNGTKDSIYYKYLMPLYSVNLFRNSFGNKSKQILHRIYCRHVPPLWVFGEREWCRIFFISSHLRYSVASLSSRWKRDDAEGENCLERRDSFPCLITQELPLCHSISRIWQQLIPDHFADRLFLLLLSTRRIQ
jgi:hypothetical protein